VGRDRIAGRRRPGRRVTGIGGKFLRARNPEKLADGYRVHLGISVKDHVAVFKWISPRSSKLVGHTVWAVLAEQDREWGPGHPTAQVNYRVHDLERTLAQLRKEGVTVSEKVEESDYGRFGWATDLEGNRMEPWEPPKRYRSPDRHASME
jgi:predicted enzyme related to lactoylglutathione lyase